MKFPVTNNTVEIPNDLLVQPARMHRLGVYGKDWVMTKSLEVLWVENPRRGMAFHLGIPGWVWSPISTLNPGDGYRADGEVELPEPEALALLAQHPIPEELMKLAEIKSAAGDANKGQADSLVGLSPAASSVDESPMPCPECGHASVYIPAKDLWNCGNRTSVCNDYTQLSLPEWNARARRIAAEKVKENVVKCSECFVILHGDTANSNPPMCVDCQEKADAVLNLVKTKMAAEKAKQASNTPTVADSQPVAEKPLVAASTEGAAGVPTVGASYDEKQGRIYYQDIVYTICNILDKINGGTIICGTYQTPTTQVADAMTRLLQDRRAKDFRIADLEKQWNEVEQILGDKSGQIAEFERQLQASITERDALKQQLASAAKPVGAKEVEEAIKDIQQIWPPKIMKSAGVLVSSELIFHAARLNSSFVEDVRNLALWAQDIRCSEHRFPLETCQVEKLSANILAANSPTPSTETPPTITRWAVNKNGEYLITISDGRDYYCTGSKWWRADSDGGWSSTNRDATPEELKKITASFNASGVWRKK